MYLYFKFTNNLKYININSQPIYQLFLLKFHYQIYKFYKPNVLNLGLTTSIYLQLGQSYKKIDSHLINVVLMNELRFYQMNNQQKPCQKSEVCTCSQQFKNRIARLQKMIDQLYCHLSDYLPQQLEGIQPLNNEDEEYYDISQPNIIQVKSNNSSSTTINKLHVDAHKIGPKSQQINISQLEKGKLSMKMQKNGEIDRKKELGVEPQRQMKYEGLRSQNKTDNLIMSDKSSIKLKQDQQRYDDQTDPNQYTNLQKQI